MRLKFINEENLVKDMAIGFATAVIGSLIMVISIESTIMFGCLGAFLTLISKVRIEND